MSSTAPNAPEQAYDLIVVGAGACGMVAALAASDAGKSVLILEKLDQPGGNSTLSTGSVPGAGTRFQREAGINDSPAEMVRDLVETSGPHEAEDLVGWMAESSAGIIEWLVDAHNIGLYLITDYMHVGHSVPRLHAPADRNGANLTRDLIRACEATGVDILVRTPVLQLRQDEHGAVSGVTAKLENGQEQDFAAPAVLLASNGFGNNKDLLAHWIPEMEHTPYFGAAGSTGEAITWAEQLGAALANVNAYQAYASVATDAGDILSWTTVELGAVIVGADGKRLGDESVGYSAFAAAVSRGGTESYTIMDQKIYDYVARNEPRFVKIINLGCVPEAGDVAALAAHIGCEETVLAETLRISNAAAGTSPDETGRTDFGLGPMEPPYYICRTQPGMFHTQGGVKVDRNARVLVGNGEPIPGLYAGGGVAAGISGLAGAAGYASGNGLLTAVGLGYAAGRHVGSR